MSGKFQKFNFRKFVFKKKKDRKYSQESIQYTKSNDKSTSKAGCYQRQPNWSDGDVSLRRRDFVADAVASASGNRYEPKFDNLSGSKKGVTIPGVGLAHGFSSAEGLNKLPKRRSRTQEPKPSPVMSEPYSDEDSMSRNVKEATWGIANTSPFFSHKSVSTPCMTVKKTAKQSSGFDGMAIGWPSLRTWDVPGPKARFSATGVHVPGNNAPINDISPSWSNMAPTVPRNVPPLTSDSRTAITNRAKKLFALKLITGEIWNPEPSSIPYFVEQELSDNSQKYRLNSIISQRPESQKDFFQDRARKSLVDTVKKVVSSHQPVNQNSNQKPQANLDTNKNFSKQVRAPGVEPSRAYSENNKLYYGKMQAPDLKAPHYRPLEQQLDNISRVTLNPVISLGNLPPPSNLYMNKLKNSEYKIPFYRPLVQQLDVGLNVNKIPNNSAPNLVNVPHANNLHVTNMKYSEQKVPYFRPLMQQSDNNLNFSKAADKPMQYVKNVPRANNLHGTDMKYSEQKVPLSRPLVHQSENSLNLNKAAADKPAQNVRNMPHPNNIYLTKMKNSEQTVPRYRFQVPKLDDELNVRKVDDNPEPNPASIYEFGMARINTKVAKLQQKNTTKQSESKPPFFEKVPHNDAWHIRKVSDFVWQKLKKMTELASSNLKQATFSSSDNDSSPKISAKKAPNGAERKLKNLSYVNNVEDDLDLDGIDLDNVRVFARPIPKHFPEYVEIPRNPPGSGRPHHKNISDPTKANMKNTIKISYPNFEKEQGYIWSKINKLSKFDDPNLKTFGVTETTIKKFPYFEVVNIKKEFDFVLPNSKKNFDFSFPNVENQVKFPQAIAEKESDFNKSNSSITAVGSKVAPTSAGTKMKKGFDAAGPESSKQIQNSSISAVGSKITQTYAGTKLTKGFDAAGPEPSKPIQNSSITTVGSKVAQTSAGSKLTKGFDAAGPEPSKPIPNTTITTVGSKVASTSAGTKLTKGFDSAGPESSEPIPNSSITTVGSTITKLDSAGPEPSEPIPATTPVLTEVTQHEVLPDQGDQNHPVPNDNEVSELNVPTLAETTEITEPKDGQAHVLSEPNFAEDDLKKQPEFVKEIPNPAPKTVNVADPGETGALQEPDIIAQLILETKPDPVRQKRENATAHSGPNLSEGSELTTSKNRKVSAIPAWQSKTTPASKGKKVENVPDLDRPNISKSPVGLNSCNNSPISPTSTFGTLNQFASAVSGKHSNSAVNILHDTTTKITVNVKSKTNNNLPKHSDKIEEKMSDSRQREVQTPWKIYVVHNAQGKEPNPPASSKQQKANGSLVNTSVPTKPPSYGSESQSGKTWKKMNSMSHIPPSTSYGCTESLITTRILKSASLQNYPPPKMFNQVERGDNKFLVFWKGREDTNIFSNPNKKQSLLMTPQSPRRSFPSGSFSPRKAAAEQQASEDDSTSKTKKSPRVKRGKPLTCLPSQDSSILDQSVSTFLPVVCVPSETLPCVVSSSDAGLQDDLLDNNK